jgi:hypothetical protein
MTINQTTMQLMHILDFTLEDLEYNKHGQLSPRQRQMLQLRKEAAIASGQRASRGTPFVLLYFIVVLAIIGVAFVATGSLQSVQNALGSLTIPVVAGVVLMLLLIVATVPRSYRRSVARYRQMAVAMPVVYPVLYVDGNLKLRTHEYGGTPDTPGYITNHYVAMGGKEFVVNEGRYKALKQAVDGRGKYRLYFADTGKSGGIILSAEEVGG